MARPWRIQYEGAIYHVMSRGVDRGKIFLTNDDYSRFLECVESAREKFNLDIFAFVLMSNHYHILLRTNEANLSRAMQWIQTAYSIYYNRNHKRSGHLFQGRYKSVLVENEALLRINTLSKESKNFRRKLEKIVSSAFKVCPCNHVLILFEG